MICGVFSAFLSACLFIYFSDFFIQSSSIHEYSICLCVHLFKKQLQELVLIDRSFFPFFALSHALFSNKTKSM